MKAKLRGHHLICLNFFKGEGYSKEFIENINSILKKKNVEIVKGGDDVCAKCPYFKEGECTEYENISYQDEIALMLLGFKLGMVVEWKEVFERIPNIIEEWKAKFCLECIYFKTCFK